MKALGMPVAAVVFLLANFTIAQGRKSATQKSGNAKAEPTLSVEKTAVGKNTLPDAGEFKTAQVADAYREAVAALRAYSDAKTKGTAQLSGTLDALTQAMKSGKVGETLPSLTAPNAVVERVDALRIKYLTAKKNLGELTNSKDLKGAQEAKLALSKLVVKENSVDRDLAGEKQGTQLKSKKGIPPK